MRYSYSGYLVRTLPTKDRTDLQAAPTPEAQVRPGKSQAWRIWPRSIMGLKVADLLTVRSRATDKSIRGGNRLQPDQGAERAQEPFRRGAA